MKPIQKSGFTLIELLVVIAIIGMLASVVLVALDNSRKKSRDAKRVADIKQIIKGMELYFTLNNTYPVCSGGIAPNNGWCNSGNSSWNTLATNLSSVLSPLPKDPINTPATSASNWAAGGSFNYAFVRGSCGKAYMLVYKLETPNSPIYSSPGINYCGNWYQYGSAVNGVVTTGQSGNN